MFLRTGHVPKEDELEDAVRYQYSRNGIEDADDVCMDQNAIDDPAGQAEPVDHKHT